jgi:hypothetical protein
MDSVVKSWIWGTISPDLQDVVQQRGHTARGAWLALENHFLGNHETRALHIDATFRSFVQGDLSVNDYYRKMKGFADSLTNLGIDVTDCVLVLNVLRGLNKNFEHLRAISRTRHPSHHSRRCLMTSTWRKYNRELRGCRSLPPPPPPSTPRRSPRHLPPPLVGKNVRQDSSCPNNALNSSSSLARRKITANNRNGGSGSGGGSSSTNTSATKGLWSSFFNPWTGTIQMWPGLGGVGAQQPHLLPQAMLIGPLLYGPPPWVGPPYTPPLAPLPVHCG